MTIHVCTCDCGDKRTFRILAAARARRWFDKHARRHGWTA